MKKHSRTKGRKKCTCMGDGCCYAVCSLKCNGNEAHYEDSLLEMFDWKRDRKFLGMRCFQYFISLPPFNI
jgi:hypothetical protein